MVKKRFTYLLMLVSLLFLVTSICVKATENREPFKLPANQKVRLAGKEAPAKIHVKKLLGKATPLYSNGNVTLYGDVIYSDNWEETNDYGVYSVNTSTGALTNVSGTGDYNFRATGGAVYKDGHYYLIGGDEYSATYYDYNTDSWEEENENEVSSTWLASDLTVNPSDNKIYAAMADGNGGQVLATVDFDAGSRTEIGALSENLVTLSSNAYGQLYGIGSDGVLYSIDASTANETAIGATGVTPSGMQSATFDFGTGELYWAASTSSNVGALYVVDVTTGKAECAAYFPGNEQIVGLYSLSAAKPWVGPDVPAAPENVKASADNGTTTITWSAPQKGLHNGIYDATTTTYSIMRLPDSVTVATNLTDTTFSYSFKPAQLAAYTYEVTASNAAGEGGKATSNAVPTGDAIIPPYVQDFTDAASFSLLTLVDADGDGSTWKPSATSHCAVSAGAPFENTDDWLFTPVISMKSGRLYRLRFTVVSTMAANYPYSIKAAYGFAPTESDASNVVQPDTLISDNEPLKLGGYFSVDKDSVYYVGVNVHGYDIQNIVLQDLRIEQGPLFSAPDSSTALTLKADTTGSNSVAIDFNAPTKSVDGNVLNKSLDIKIYRDTTLISTLTDIQPGSHCAASDNGATLNTYNSYRVIACNENGDGLAAEDSVYVGIDQPMAPEDVQATYADNGKVLLSWKAPVTGVNGGFINPQHLTYGIQRSVGGQAEVIATDNATTSFTDNIDETGEQDYQLYAVAAKNVQGYSEIATSNVLIKGAPYTLPFKESLPDGERSHFWMASSYPSGGHASWGTDGSSFRFTNSYNSGDGALLASGKIDAGSATNPILEYKYFYRAEAGDDSLNVYLIKNGTDTILIDDRGYTLYMYAKDYEQVTVPLAQYIDSNTKFFQIAFGMTTYSSDAIQLAAVTDITVRDQKDDDLYLTSLTAPAEANAGDSIDVKTDVINYGANKSGTFSVNLLESGRTIATQTGTALLSGEDSVFTFKVPVGTLKDKLAFSCSIDYSADLDLTNNSSDTDTTTVNLPCYPVPTGATAAKKGNDEVCVSWTAPDYQQFTVPAIDGAEDYADFIIDSIGQWTVRDMDGKNTRSDLQVEWTALNYEHAGEPMSWIVMNPSKAGAAYTNWMGEPTGWQPVSGDRFFMSVSSAEGTNDDWLISPELTGEAQTISFWQHGYYGMESYEVLYSTTDTATASFVSLGTKTSSSSWEQVSFDLPEGARYFAIRNLGAEYSSYLMVDDINFKPLSNKGALSLKGYNVYCNGQLVATVDASTTTFTDNSKELGELLYQITAIYNLGESASASASVATGIQMPQTSGQGIRVNGNHVAFDGSASVYDISGRKIFSGGLSNGINLPAGTYILRSGNQAVKFIIR